MHPGPSVKHENDATGFNGALAAIPDPPPLFDDSSDKPNKSRARLSGRGSMADDDRHGENPKRRAVVSSACLACRRRKSKVRTRR
jgi:hypothetical protein